MLYNNIIIILYKCFSVCLFVCRSLYEFSRNNVTLVKPFIITPSICHEILQNAWRGIISRFLTLTMKHLKIVHEFLKRNEWIEICFYIYYTCFIYSYTFLFVVTILISNLNDCWICEFNSHFMIKMTICFKGGYTRQQALLTSLKQTARR